MKKKKRVNKLDFILKARVTDSQFVFAQKIAQLLHYGSISNYIRSLIEKDIKEASGPRR